LGIRQVGTLRKTAQENGAPVVTLYFSSDTNIVFPFRLKNIYPLVLKSDSDDTPVHSEKVKALKRALIADWDEE